MPGVLLGVNGHSASLFKHKEIPMSKTIILKNLKIITATGDKLNGLIHETAILVCEHAQEHGDCTLALDLCKAMPASMRREMLVLWFSLFTPIRVVVKNDKVGMLKATQKGYTPFDLEAGKAEPFYELAEKNPEGKIYDFAALLELARRLGKTVQKKIDDGKVEANDVDSAKAIVAALTSFNVPRVITPDNTDVKTDKPEGDNVTELKKPETVVPQTAIADAMQLAAQAAG